jgi:hypothetical protein
MAELKIIPVEKPEGKLSWLTNTILSNRNKIYKIYKSKERLYLHNKYKNEWYQLIDF